MSHTSARFAWIAAIVAALIFAVPAIAAAAGAGSPVKAKQYAKYCGSQGKGGRVDKCIKAMRKLATGKSSSPRTACAGLSRKRPRGKPRSVYSRCVRAGSRLVKGRRKADAGAIAEERAGENADEGSVDDDSANSEDGEDDAPPSDKWLPGTVDDDRDERDDPTDPVDDAQDTP
jgi:hypothetical protein